MTQAIQAANIDPGVKDVLEKVTQTKLIALATAVDVLAAKLNADAGVTDTDYAVTNAAAARA